MSALYKQRQSNNSLPTMQLSHVVLQPGSQPGLYHCYPCSDVWINIFHSLNYLCLHIRPGIIMLYCNSIIFWVLFYFIAFYFLRYFKYFFYTVTFKILLVPLDFRFRFYRFMNLADSLILAKVTYTWRQQANNPRETTIVLLLRMFFKYIFNFVIYCIL